VLVVVATTQSEAARWQAEVERWRGKAERWQVEAEQLGADNAVLRARVADLEGQVGALAERVATLAKLAFGVSSEKKKPPGLTTGDDAGGGTTVTEERRRGQQSGSKGHGRRDYSGVETIEVFHDVPEDQRVCPECGTAYVAFGEESCEQIDWEVRIVRVVHRRPTYRRGCACPVRGVLVAPVPPKAIPKGRFSTQFLARLVVEKYVLGRPLERVVAALAADGLEVPKGTLVGALKALFDLFAPLDAAIRARNATGGHLHVDETSWRVFEEVAGKENNRWWLWTFVGPDTVVFLIDPTRSTKVVADHLGVDVNAGSLEAGRTLLISSDFYSVYQSLASVEGVEPLWCWAHIRRYFIRAADACKDLKLWADEWLERIRVLYVAHRALGSTEAGSAGHARAQADLSGALHAIDVARKAQGADETLHRRAAKVLQTLDHEREGLARHESFSELPLDNNAAERALRRPVVVRKNCYGSGSKWAADLAASTWTLTATAALAGCNPLAYLRSYLDACAKAGGKAPSGESLEAFFPWSASEADLAAWGSPQRGRSP
jgi:transposase